MKAALETSRELFQQVPEDASQADAERLFAQINRAHRPHVLALDPREAALFLPHCLKSRDCVGTNGEEGLRCARCGRCAVAGLLEEAEATGVQAFCVPGGSLVAKLVEKHRPRALIGVACQKEILLALKLLHNRGVLFQVFPLDRDGCFETALDASPLRDLLTDWRERQKSGGMEKMQEELLGPACDEPIPERYDDRLLSRLCGETAYAYDTVGPTRAIAEPVRDFLARGGKGLRSRLFGIVLEAFGKDENEYQDLMQIVELSHNGTLIIDDIEDGSSHRRGKPCIHHIYGTDVAMNAGNALYFLSLLPLLRRQGQLPEERRSQIFEIYVQGMIRLHFGQSMDIAWHKGLLALEKITEENYLQMCGLKTGALYQMSAEMAGVLAEAEPAAVQELGRFGSAIGTAYQIQDDVLDLQGERFAAGKGGSGKDITEGKVTLLVIHALRRGGAQDRERLKEILALHTTDPALIQEGISILTDCGSIEFASGRARQILDEACDRVRPFLPEAPFESRLRPFVCSFLTRDL
ncbi:MAG: polyprenyl synthetase family protein [bacterium]